MASKLGGTRVHEIADGLFQIHTPVAAVVGGFSFNQYLLRDDASLLFHTGPRALFASVREAIAQVMPLETLRYVAFGHIESDECGSLNQLLEVAPNAVPLCGQIAAMVSVNDLANRPAKALPDNEPLSLGRNTIRWLDAPHVPHAWENGYIMIDNLRALLCGDLLTQPGTEHKPLVEGDILGPSEAMRAQLDYFAHGPNTGAVLQRLAALRPKTLACMHGSAWQGDGEALLTSLRAALAA
jgi:flavorubredoxin